jgi:hypothetical protein
MYMDGGELSAKMGGSPQYSISIPDVGRVFSPTSAFICNAKCRRLKKFTCTGTLRQVFIRVYRLEIVHVTLALEGGVPMLRAHRDVQNSS